MEWWQDQVQALGVKNPGSDDLQGTYQIPESLKSAVCAFQIKEEQGDNHIIASFDSKGKKN